MYWEIATTFKILFNIIIAIISTTIMKLDRHHHHQMNVIVANETQTI